MNYQDNEGLQEFTDRLDRSHYYLINALCVSAKKYALQLEQLEMHKATSQYVTLCNRLIQEILHFVTIRKEYFVPYLLSLSEKNEDGHDCKNCTGTATCSAQHDLHLAELKQSHKQLKATIYQVQMAALPLYAETIYPDVYRLLRNHMALIGSSLTDLYTAEEIQLIPKVIEAQRNINARD